MKGPGDSARIRASEPGCTAGRDKGARGSAPPSRWAPGSPHCWQPSSTTSALRSLGSSGASIPGHAVTFAGILLFPTHGRCLIGSARQVLPRLVRPGGGGGGLASSTSGTSSMRDTMRINHSLSEAAVFFLHSYLRASAWKTGWRCFPATHSPRLNKGGCISSPPPSDNCGAFRNRLGRAIVRGFQRSAYLAGCI